LEGSETVSQELSDAERIQRVISILENDDTRGYESECEFLRSIAARLERQVLETKLWCGAGGWCFNPPGLDTRKLSEMLGVAPQIHMPVKVTIHPA
jgi:hypothetical protein